ncbi:MAG: tRNA (guanosine(37)-N1)-methyltransferase TrmD [Gammaproteobacteria bacterium]|nr:tRNA (guanosine(37)-N1)-methyltransferase TrmD [Gammaproteobacteria bacterium]
MFAAVTQYGITRRAIERQLIDVELWNPRDYTMDNHRTVDDRPYGGGPGMVMMVEPLKKAVSDARRAAQQAAGAKVKIIYLSPQGIPLNQQMLRESAALPGLILLAGRYEGIDERLIESEIDEEWSIGDYVLSGGELAAMVIIDGITRLLPGALGHDDSAGQDSFFNGLLDYPHYTRPESVDGRTVPGILLSGDHRAIERWRLKQALGRTWQRRPELLARLQLNDLQNELLEEFIREQQKT